MKLNRTFMRSVPGQLTLLGVTFAGALALAIVTLCLRSVFFERFVYDKHPKLEEPLATLAQDLAAGRAGTAQIDDAIKEEAKRKARPSRVPGDPSEPLPPEVARMMVLDVLYGAWLADSPEEPSDPLGKLARELMTSYSSDTLALVKRTLTVGNPEQRLRAVELLALSVGSSERTRQEAAELAEYACARATRRHEPELAQQASAVLAQLRPEHN
jgi:hypothetical protein